MFLVPPGYSGQIKRNRVTIENPVCLRSKHLVLHQDVVLSVFGEDTTVYMAYYPDKNIVMIAPHANEMFRKIHKVKQYLMKAVAANGEHAIPLHGLLLDNDLDIEDRVLNYEANSKLNILTVYF